MKLGEPKNRKKLQRKGSKAPGSPASTWVLQSQGGDLHVLGEEEKEEQGLAGHHLHKENYNFCTVGAERVSSEHCLVLEGNCK